MRVLISAALVWLCLGFSCLCSSGCGGLHDHVRRTAVFASAPLSAECDSLDRQYRLWGAIAIGASSLAGGAALLEAVPEDDRKNLRIGLAVFGLVDAAVGAVAIFMRDSVTSQYADVCEAAAAKVTP